MTGSYFFALGACVPVHKLRRVLDDVCPEAEAIPVPSSDLRAAFPDTDNVVFVAGTSERADIADRLISHRHTPTRALRRLVQRMAQEFGGLRLLVYQKPAGALAFGLAPVRSQTTTLTGFLRSGRVVQDDTLLSIVPARHRRPRRSFREKPRLP